MTEPNAVLIVLATLVGVSLCRVGGFFLGRFLPDTPHVRDTLDKFPACALAAVIGPQLAALDPIGLLACAVAVGLLLIRVDLLAAFAIGCGVLLTPAILQGLGF